MTSDLGMLSFTGQETISWGLLLQACLDLNVDLYLSGLNFNKSAAAHHSNSAAPMSSCVWPRSQGDME